MAYRRVVYISEITVGSKFRLVGNRIAAAQQNKFRGTSWASCQINNQGGNWQFPQFKPFIIPPVDIAGERIPVKFTDFPLPCPARFNRRFPPSSGKLTTRGFSLFFLPKFNQTRRSK